MLDPPGRPPPPMPTLPMMDPPLGFWWLVAELLKRKLGELEATVDGPWNGDLSIRPMGNVLFSVLFQCLK